MFSLPSLLDILVRGIFLTSFATIWILILVRLVGLRSLSKMTAFDFVATIAVGSLLAAIATASQWKGLAQGLVALATLFMVQWLLARIRRRSKRFANLIANEPTLLMENGKFMEDALKQTRVAKADVYAKIRAANATDLANVRAVVLETTGDISILHGDPIDSELLAGVKRVGRSDT